MVSYAITLMAVLCLPQPATPPETPPATDISLSAAEHRKLARYAAQCRRLADGSIWSREVEARSKSASGPVREAYALADAPRWYCLTTKAVAPDEKSAHAEAHRRRLLGALPEGAMLVAGAKAVFITLPSLHYTILAEIDHDPLLILSDKPPPFEEGAIMPELALAPSGHAEFEVPDREPARSPERRFRDIMRPRPVVRGGSKQEIYAAFGPANPPKSSPIYDMGEVLRLPAWRIVPIPPVERTDTANPVTPAELLEATGGVLTEWVHLRAERGWTWEPRAVNLGQPAK